LALRDLAAVVAKAKGATTTQITAPDQPGQLVFQDARLRNLLDGAASAKRVQARRVGIESVV
jgi:hypothetical protein